LLPERQRYNAFFWVVTFVFTSSRMLFLCS